jgi:hypothetical protein
MVTTDWHYEHTKDNKSDCLAQRDAMALGAGTETMQKISGFESHMTTILFLHETGCI